VGWVGGGWWLFWDSRLYLCQPCGLFQAFTSPNPPGYGSKPCFFLLPPSIETCSTPTSDLARDSTWFFCIDSLFLEAAGEFLHIGPFLFATRTLLVEWISPPFLHFPLLPNLRSSGSLLCIAFLFFSSPYEFPRCLRVQIFCRFFPFTH